MSIWIIVKPRLRSYDAMDLFINRLAYLPGSQIFIMKPEYASKQKAINHDEFFSNMLDGPIASKHAADFMNIFLSQSLHSHFTPLLTNRLLTPILPRNIDPSVGNIRRRVRNRLDNMYKNTGELFKNQDVNCLIIKPDNADLCSAFRFGMLLEDGYSRDRVQKIIDQISESIGYAEYRIRNEKTFTKVHDLNIPTGASFVFMYQSLLKLGIRLPEVVSVDWFQPQQALDFYLSEMLIPSAIRSSIINARPTIHSQVARSYGDIIESLILTRQSNKASVEMAHSVIQHGMINFSSLTDSEALHIDEYHRQKCFWRIRGE